MIRLVTDSGSQLTPELRERYAVEVVPLSVTVDDVSLLENVEIDAEGIAAALRRDAAVRSATPPPGRFLAAYARAEAGGATQVLSVHSGGAASGTANSARVAAGSAPLPVLVVDTGTASFPVALCVWAAGEVLAAGGTVEDAAGAAGAVAAEVDNVFVVGTPALARRGGRLAPAEGAPGVPVLALHEGAMRAVGSVSDVGAAVAAMTDYVVAAAGGRRLRVGVGDLGAGDLADELEAALRERVEVERLVRYVVGPSVAVHTGLGTVGCVFHPVSPVSPISPAGGPRPR